MFDLIKAYKFSHKSTNVYLNYLSAFPSLKIGTSFSPEYCEEIGLDQKQSLEVLRFAVEELGITNIRFGLRWTNSENSLSYYEPFLRYLMDQRVNICLNIGPVKVFRWPEEHVPESILSSIKRPDKDSEIDSDSELGKKAIEHTKNFLHSFVEQFSAFDIFTIKEVQIENEAFFKFGKNKWVFSDEYIREVIEITNQYLPNVKLLINSAGRTNLKRITNLFDYLYDEGISDHTQMIVGYDYYYKIPPLCFIPLIKYLDNFSFPFSMNTKKLKEFSIQKRFSLEVTEMQMETWGDVKSPGNSVKEFKFALYRCLDKLFPSKGFVIRVWGIEKLGKKFINQKLTEDHKDIIKIIKSVNAKKII